MLRLRRAPQVLCAGQVPSFADLRRRAWIREKDAAGRGRIAAALVAGLAVLTVAAPAAGQSRLVSNLGQESIGRIERTSSLSQYREQQFTTGPNAEGYTVSEIELDFQNAFASSGTVGHRFAIHKSVDAAPTLFYDTPGDEVVRLTGTLPAEYDLRLSLTPASTTTLEPSTRYFVVLRMTNGLADFYVTHSDDIDSGASPGWDISDEYDGYMVNPAFPDDPLLPSFRMAVKGTLGTTSGQTPVTLVSNFGQPRAAHEYGFSHVARPPSDSRRAAIRPGTRSRRLSSAWPGRLEKTHMGMGSRFPSSPCIAPATRTSDSKDILRAILETDNPVPYRKRKSSTSTLPAAAIQRRGN